MYFTLFGYKNKISTEICIFSFKEIVNYYHKQRSPVYACYLDVKSAFDEASYYKLFTKLLERGVPKKTVNVLRVWHVNQAICVVWGEQLSHKFHM